MIVRVRAPEGWISDLRIIRRQGIKKIAQQNPAKRGRIRNPDATQNPIDLNGQMGSSNAFRRDPISAGDWLRCKIAKQSFHRRAGLPHEVEKAGGEFSNPRALLEADRLAWN